MAKLAVNGEIRVLAPSGMLGTGFQESSLKEGLRREPHFIGQDAGSTDAGPYSLGSGSLIIARSAIKRDLRLMLLAARQANIPLLIGSCLGGGGDPQLQVAVEVLEEVAREEGLRFRAAVIHSEQDKDRLIEKYRAGKIKPLKPSPPFDEDTIRRSARVVGMMGAEPFAAAVEAGADVVLAGRASDTAIFASLPVHLGFPKGFAWHAGKILECGAGATERRSSGPDCLFATIRKDSFVVEPLAPELRCTAQSVAAHALYENAHPYLLREPSGTLDLTGAEYAAIDDRSVRVTGSAFVPADQYTIKLEGAELVGYQSALFCSIRDPYIIRQLDDFLARADEKGRGRVRSVFGPQIDNQYRIDVMIYGRNGTMGVLEPVKTIAHEVFLIFKVTAGDQETARSIANIFRHLVLHLTIPEWSGLITGIACPFSPAYLDKGPVYQFSLNQVVEVDDPHELFRTEYLEIH